MQGDLTIRGVTKPITLEVEFPGTSKNPWGKTVAGIAARTTVNRKDFGMKFDAALTAPTSCPTRPGRSTRRAPTSPRSTGLQAFPMPRRSPSTAPP